MKIYSSLLCLLVGLFAMSCSEEKETPTPPSNSVNFTVTANGTDITLSWDADSKAYDIWRACDDDEFEKVGENIKNSPFTERVDKPDNTRLTYRMVEAGGDVYSQEARKTEQSVRISLLSEDELLDIVQQRTLKYFYDFAQPDSKLARERDSSGDVVTTGGTGFGIMALIAGAERNFISRNDAYNHIHSIVEFLKKAPRFHGAYAHWYDGKTGAVKPFSEKDNGGDLVETAFLMQGLLTAKAYFGAESASAEEKALAADIDQIWQEVEWDWYERDGMLKWHWSPDYDFAMNLGISGWNEGLIAYVLAASSPTHPIEKATYVNGFTHNGSIRNGNSFYGITLPLGSQAEQGGPLFFAHYSFLGLDPRGLKDDVCDNYFEQNRAHTLINRAYCIENPKNYKGYSENFWGLTASDCPVAGYIAHAPGNNDNGTVSPTAALSSMPYTPEESMKVLEYLYRELGDEAFGEYGFYDAINLSVEKDKQVVKSYLAIDQGPIVVMIENYRSQLLWNLFMQNNDVINGLQRLGFTR